MSQPSIKSFFRPLASDKRAGEQSNGNGQSKKMKSEKEKDDAIALKIEMQAKATPALSTAIGASWFLAFQKEYSKFYFTTLSESLVRERMSHIVYPPENEVFTWTQMNHIRDTKVVIIGQDPYHEPNQAHGLAFSVKKGVRIPPSLKNIFKELVDDIAGFSAPDHGDLTGWAKQGVLLLNSTLTVRKGEANSHQSIGWETFTDAVIKWLSCNLANVVFMLWGAFAQRKSTLIDSDKHLILKSSHPSPFSYDRGFKGCKHFSKANTYLRNHGKEEINWSDL